MKKVIRISMVLLFMSFATLVTFADPPGPPTGDPTAPEGNGGPVGSAPIDGGLGILLALGAAYGGFKLYKSRQENKEEDLVTE